MTFIENYVQVFLCKKMKQPITDYSFDFFYMMERHADFKSKHDRYMVAYESHHCVDPKPKHTSCKCIFPALWIVPILKSS